jgi:hypothetical protein
MSHRLEYGSRLAIAAGGVLLCTQSTGSAGQSDSQAPKTVFHVSAYAVPALTRATPTAERQSFTEAYLTQAMLMAGLSRGAFSLATTLNFEGLTMERGELATGAHGEGYVDRRHPHTYLHELIAAVEHRGGRLSASLSAGRGFAPFGSDDPMARPFQKYPVNHHLAQILERVVAVGAVRRGPLTLEGALFNGDEPTSASSTPIYEHFGDSWAARVIWTPALATGTPLELTASHAAVESPEVAFGGGLNHAKYSATARWNQASADRRRYALAEWAKTDAETPFGRPAGSYQSWLLEAAFCRGGPRFATRLERTDRPEEERLENPFRSPVPAHDYSVHGVTRWTTATVSLSTMTGIHSVVARPFVEIALGAPRALNAGSAFEPRSFYGSGTVWMISAGARLSVGMMHDRMGRYGVVPGAPGEMSRPQPSGAHAGHHEGMSSSMERRADRCAL